MSPKKQAESVDRSVTLSIPELDQSKAAVLNTLASQHSRRSYEYAIERFIAWYCSEPRLTFNRSVVVKYRSFLTTGPHLFSAEIGSEKPLPKAYCIKYRANRPPKPNIAS
jgi:hypothetical protein